jgi:hypothetical protein
LPYNIKLSDYSAMGLYDPDAHLRGTLAFVGVIGGIVTGAGMALYN